jgi:hypothetical protein
MGTRIIVGYRPENADWIQDLFRPIPNYRVEERREIATDSDALLRILAMSGGGEIASAPFLGGRGSNQDNAVAERDKWKDTKGSLVMYPASNQYSVHSDIRRILSIKVSNIESCADSRKRLEKPPWREKKSLNMMKNRGHEL